MSTSTNAPSAPEIDRQLAQRAVHPPNAMDRERVEDLVGEDDAIERSIGRAAVQPIREAGRLESIAQRPHPPLVDLDRAVADGARERGVTHGVEQGRRQRALARAVLDDDERVRTLQALPGLHDGPGEHLAEDRMKLRGGQEVAAATGPGIARPVVAAVGVVQRELHEPRERHRPAAPDLVADPLHERGILADVREVGRPVAPELGSQVRHGADATCALVIAVRRASEGEAQARPDQRVAAEHDRDRRIHRGRRQGAQPGVLDASLSGADRMRTGPPPPASRPRPRRTDVRAAPACRRSAASPSRARCLAERLGTIAVEQRAEHGRSRSLVGAAGPQAALLDECPGPRRGACLQPGEVAPRTPVPSRPARSAGSATTDPTASMIARTRAVSAPWSHDRHRPPSSTRSSGPSMSIPSRVRPRRSSTGTPACSSSQRGSALSVGRSGTVASARRACATAMTSAE